MASQPTESSSARDFASFMRAYQDMVFTTAARIAGSDRQAEDIAQEVFLRAYERYGALRDSPTAGGWLRTVATNLAINHLARYRRRWRLFSEMRAQDAEEDGPQIDVALPEDVLAQADADLRHEIIERALERLPDRQRVPLVLFHFEELSYEEIAARLGVSLAKVKIDIFRGRAALAKTLMRRGVTAELALGEP